MPKGHPTHVGLISDIHFGLRLPHAQMLDGSLSSDRLEDVSDAMKRVLDGCVNEGIKDLFILGDVFHTRSPSGPAQREWARFVARARKRGVALHVLPGNHDAHDRRGACYTLDAYHRLRVPGVEILAFGEMVDVGPATFLPVPWVPEKRLRELLSNDIKEIVAEEAQKDRKVVLLIHCQVVSAYDAGWKLEAGVLRDDLAACGADAVYSGHVHTPQDFGLPIPGRYLGSPMVFAFGELRPGERWSNPPAHRGWWKMDLQTLEAQMVPLASTPEFRVIEHTGPADRKSVATWLEPLDVPLYLRLDLTGPRTDVEAIEEQVNAVRHANPDGVRKVVIRATYTDDGLGLRTVATGSGDEPPTDEQLIESFVKHAMAGDKDEERYIRIGKELLR